MLRKWWPALPLAALIGWLWWGESRPLTGLYSVQAERRTSAGWQSIGPVLVDFQRGSVESIEGDMMFVAPGKVVGQSATAVVSSAPIEVTAADGRIFRLDVGSRWQPGME